MKIVKIGPYTIELFDSIEDLPVVRFHKYNKLLLVDAGVGSDISDIHTHVDRAIRFCKSKPDHAIQELENLRQNIYMVQTELSPKFLAFAALIKSIDGDPQNDLSDDGLKAIIEKLKDLPVSEINDQSASVKKKIDSELQIYYPNLFEDSSVKEYYDQMRQRTLAILDAIISGDDRKQKEVEELTQMLLTFSKPMIFLGPESIEVQYDKNFENMCLMLAQKLNIEPKTYTVLAFYNAFEYLKSQAKELKAKQKNGRK